MLATGIRFLLMLLFCWLGIILLIVLWPDYRAGTLLYSTSSDEELTLWIADTQSQIRYALLRLPDVQETAQIHVSPRQKSSVFLLLDSGQGFLLRGGGRIHGFAFRPGARFVGWYPDDSAFILLHEEHSTLWQISLEGEDIEPMLTLPDTVRINEKSAFFLRPDEVLRIVTATREGVFLEELVLATGNNRRVQGWDFGSRVQHPALFLANGDTFILPAESTVQLDLELYYFAQGEAEPQNLSNNPTRNDSYPVAVYHEQAIGYRGHNGMSQSLVLQYLGSHQSQQFMIGVEGRIWNLRPDFEQESLGFIESRPGQDRICVFTWEQGEMVCPVQAVDIGGFGWWNPR